MAESTKASGATYVKRKPTCDRAFFWDDSVDGGGWESEKLMGWKKLGEKNCWGGNTKKTSAKENRVGKTMRLLKCKEKPEICIDVHGGNIEVFGILWPILFDHSTIQPFHSVVNDIINDEGGKKEVRLESRHRLWQSHSSTIAKWWIIQPTFELFQIHLNFKIWPKKS